jgi:hypothetical protein
MKIDPVSDNNCNRLKILTLQYLIIIVSLIFCVDTLHDLMSSLSNDSYSLHFSNLPPLLPSPALVLPIFAAAF